MKIDTCIIGSTGSGKTLSFKNYKNELNLKFNQLVELSLTTFSQKS